MPIAAISLERQYVGRLLLMGIVVLNEFEGNGDSLVLLTCAVKIPSECVDIGYGLAPRLTVLRISEANQQAID